MEYWIRVHWFELSALVLLALNLWFVVKVLSVLRAVQDGLLLLARWLDIARSDIDRQPDDGRDADRPTRGQKASAIIRHIELFTFCAQTQLSLHKTPKLAVGMGLPTWRIFLANRERGLGTMPKGPRGEKRPPT